MPTVADTCSGMEMAITTEYLAVRLDRLIESLQDCLGVTGDCGDVLAKGDDAGDLQSSGGDSAILLAANGVGDNSVAWITEGDDLADEGGGEGVGSLLGVKGRSCNLDASACDSMADQREEVPIVDICESPRCRPRHVGQVRHNGGRCPRHARQSPHWRQVQAERCVDSICVRQVHSLEHAGLPLAPTLLVDDVITVTTLTALGDDQQKF
jgi:hypothetical protein